MTGKMKTVESKSLDSVLVDVFYENALLGLPFDVADTLSLKSVFNSVNNIQGANTKHRIESKSVVRFLIQHMNILLLQ